MKEQCEGVMTRNVQTCTETDPVSRAAQIMRERNVGFVPIIDAKHHVKGVVTDRDLTLRALGANKSGATQLKTVMTSENLLTVKPSDTIELAEKKMMKAGVGRVLVTDQQGKLVGVITRSEIARTEPTERTGEVLGALTRGHRKSAVSAR